MSWKLGELKWRQELGLYESRWERMSIALPVERKQAVEAYEQRKRVSSPHRRAAAVRHSPTQSPQRRQPGLGRQPSMSLDFTSPRLSLLPAPFLSHSQHLSHEQVIPASDSFAYSSSQTPLQPLLADQNLKKGHQRGLERSQSGPELRCLQLSPHQPQALQLCTPTSSPFKHSSIFSPAVAIRTPKTPRSREELTRLLDHIETPLSDRSPTRDKSRSSLRQDVQPEKPSTYSPSGLCHPYLQQPSILKQKDVLRLQETDFRLLDADFQVTLDDIFSSTDTAATIWPSTVSRHRSTSTLLPRHKMSGSQLPRREDQQTPAEEDSNTTANPRFQSPGQGVRRTTPIYQHFDQAYAGVMGGHASPRVTSPPGTESLNNVYTRAMVEDDDRGRDDHYLPSAGMLNTRRNSRRLQIGRGPTTPGLTMPFQRSDSPDNEDHMLSHDSPNASDAGNNPAGLPLGPNDVPLQPRPVLRNVQRGSITPITSPAPQPSSVTFDTTESSGRSPTTISFQEPESPRRDHRSGRPPRARTPYPFGRRRTLSPGGSNDADSTIGAIVDNYATDDTRDVLPPVAPPSYPESQGPAGGTPLRPVLPPVTTGALGPPPAWPLPVPSIAPLVDGIYRNGLDLSSSPPTYDATTALLGNHDFSNVMIPDLGRFPSFQNDRSLVVGGMSPAAQHNNTPVQQDENTLSTIDNAQLLQHVTERLLQHEHDEAAPAVQEPHPDDVAEEPESSSSSSTEPVFAGNSLLRVRDALRNRDSAASGNNMNGEDDAAWETTQGTNTQRNSAVPEGDLPDYPSNSSLRANNPSAWDPLAVRRHQTQEAVDDFARIMQGRRIERFGTNEEGLAQGCEQSSSPEEPTEPSITQQAATSRTSTSSPFFSSPSPQRVRPTSHFRPSPLKSHTDHITPSATLVEMSSTSAPEANSQDEITPWREQVRVEVADDVLEVARRSDPDRPRTRREFPDAHLTINKSVVEAENEAAFVARQRRLTWLVMGAALVLFPFGGFAALHSVAGNGDAARGAVLQLSLRDGGAAVNNINEREARVAERLVVVGAFAWVAGLGAVVAAVVAGMEGVW